MKKKKKGVLLFLMSIVLGGFLYIFVDMLKAGAESHEIILDVKILIPWISAICLVLGFISILLTFNFLKKSRKFHSLYQEEMDDDLNGSHITLSLSFLALVLIFSVQKYLFKTISIVRQFDLAFFSIPKDMLDYVNSYDEGERQANLEQSFRILFQLNQYILPGLYILIDIVSVLTGEIQLLGLLAVAVVHIYINIMYIPMVKRYFK